MTERPLAFQIKATNNQIRRLMERSAILENHENLTGMQFGMLGFIGDRSGQEPVFQRDIEAEFNIRRSTASTMIISLEKQGYIRRESVPGDARLKSITLTGKAKRLDKIAKENIMKLQEKLVRGIPDQELELFYKVLLKIQQNAGD